MRIAKKALSVFLCAVMLITTLCFFPVTFNVGFEADAAVVTDGTEVAFYAPEVIYLYPDVTSWKSSVKTPFQYYVGNSVNTADIYAAPTTNTLLENTGRIYFAAEEGMNDVSLSYRFMKTTGEYYDSAAGVVEFSVSEKSGWYEFEILSGISPELAANETGCYIRWDISYKTDAGENRSASVYTYVYKPYVVTYGAVGRVFNEQGDVNVYGQNITWVSGVHAIDNTASARNTLYPLYQTVETSADTSTYAFSPFLSKDNVAYVGATEVSGAAVVANGGYNAVFSGSDPSTAYFWAGQQGAAMSSSIKAKDWFYTAVASYTYDRSYDYMNGEPAFSSYALSQVTPTKIGSITVDISRYSDLSQIPNLAVGYMITDTDSKDAVTTSTTKTTAQWYVGNGTGYTHLATGAYDTYEDISAASGSVGAKFASVRNLTTPAALGIKYAGAWECTLDKTVSQKTYTVKSYYESIDRELDRQAVSSAIGLVVNQNDKSSLRAAVDRAVSLSAELGVKSNDSSYYYDSFSAEWKAFVKAYKEACLALTNVESTADYTALANALNSALDTLLSGKALKITFDVNYGGINPNLYVAPSSVTDTAITMTWDAANETLTFNGSATENAQLALTSFAPYEGNYYFSAEKVSGSFVSGGCLAFDSSDLNGSNVTNAAGTRYNFDFRGSDVKVMSYEAENHMLVDGMRLWAWYNESVPTAFNNLAVRIKIEEGSEKTAYSPAAKITTGSTYGTLPVPSRTGYTFAGWYLDKALTEIATADTAVSSRTLYAKWTPNKYSVSFDNMLSINEWANTGNSAGAAGTANGTIVYNADNSSVTVTSNPAKGECYSIWDSSTYGVEVKPDTAYRFSYTVSDWNGVGQHQAFMFIYVGNERVGFADGKEWADVSKYATGNGTFYIDFTTGEEAETFRFRIGTNNGSTDESVKATFSAISLVEKTDYNMGLTISTPEKTAVYDGEGYGELAAASREGYTFEGWYTGVNGTGEKITAQTEVKSENIRVYSNWLANAYTVHFNANTGNGAMDDVAAVFDTSFILPENAFTKTGYTFVGWSLTADGEVVYTDAEEVSNLSSVAGGEVTLYAVWKANTFNVSFDGNTNTDGAMDDVQIVYDSGALLPGCGYNKTGFTFVGWSLTADGNVITDAEYDNLRTEEGDTVTLYAIWSVNSYTVTFNANGGTGETSQRTLTFTDDITLPKNMFAKTGYTLAGWSLTKGGEMVYLNGETVSGISSKDGDVVTLYAVWTANTYTLRFNEAGGKGTMSDALLTYDAEYILPANSFTKEGYHFMGWALTEGGRVEYADNAAVINLKNKANDTVTLYAVWEINTYTVTFTFCDAAGTVITREVSVKHGDAAAVPTEFVYYPAYSSSQHNVFMSWSKEFNRVTESFTTTARYQGSAEAHEMTSSTTDSTCASAGETIHYCTKCAYSYSVAIAKKPHTWSEGIITTAPGCVTDGIRTYTCIKCSATKGEVVGATGHDFVEFPANEPTCDAEGNIAHKHCENCHSCYSSTAAKDAPYSEALDDSDVKIPTIPHTPGDEATCTAAQICTVCNNVITEALGHTEEISYKDVNASCTAEGTYTLVRTCTVCGNTAEESKTGLLPHTYETEDVAATCTAEGYTKHTCTVCSYSFNDSYTEKLSHVSGEWEVTTPATCTEYGLKTHLCAVCSNGYEYEDIEPNGHTEGKWVQVSPPLCDAFGTKALKCADCEETIRTDFIIPLEHEAGDWVITVEPGCETAGTKSLLCVHCESVMQTQIVPETGHTAGAPATCEDDQTCTVCNKVLKNKLKHSWDEGTVTKKPTDKLEGVLTYTCINDENHKKTEAIPVITVITLPELPADGTYDIDADMNNSGGNMFDLITVEDGISVFFIVSKPDIIAVDYNGNITAKGEGYAEITIRTSDGMYELTLPVTVRRVRTVTFSANGQDTVVYAYKGQTVTPPEVSTYTDENGFIHTFKAWTLRGSETTNFTVTGDMTFVAVYTTGCDYSDIDRLEKLLNDALSGIYDNNTEIITNKDAIAAAKALIAEFKKDRETRDGSQQALVDAACAEISKTITKLCPADSTTVEIRGEMTVNAGDITSYTAYLMPVETALRDCIWTSSDSSIGFFKGDKFYAVGAGVVTVTATSGDYTGTADITVTAGAGTRVVMFDTLLASVSYIVEGTYIVSETTNLFWPTDAPMYFRVVYEGELSDKFVYMNDILIEPDANGIYTIPANSGDVQIRIEGVVTVEKGQRLSFWEMIVDFFNKIAEFFANLFKF